MHPMRRSDRALPKERAIELLKTAEWGVFSTASGDGEPHGVPINYVLVGEDIIYLHCAKKGQKLDNIDANPRASFAVVGTSKPVYDTDFTSYFESAIATGPATRVAEEGEKIEALRLLCEKYLPEHMDKFNGALRSLPATEVVRIDIHSLTGKAKLPKPQASGMPQG